MSARTAVANITRMCAARNHTSIECNEAVLFGVRPAVASRVRDAAFGVTPAPAGPAEARLAMTYRSQWRLFARGGDRGAAVALFVDFFTSHLAPDGTARATPAVVGTDAVQGVKITMKGLEARVKAACRDARVSLAAGTLLHVIALHRAPLGSAIRADVCRLAAELSRGPRLRVQLWSTHYFAHFDPASRTFPHTRVPADDLEAALKPYVAGGASESSRLPLLQANDFMYRYLALRPGEVVRVDREDAKRGPYAVFRVAAPSL